MRSIIVTILHALVAQAVAKLQGEDHSPNKAGDMMLDNLVDQLIDRVSPVQHADLEETTLGKPRAGPGMARSASMITQAQPIVPRTVGIGQDKLNKFGTALALTAIDGYSHGPAGAGMRNIAAMASRMPTNIRAELSAKVKEMAGITAPTGYFDPFDIGSGVDDDLMARYREAELKHGRYGMLASLGIAAGEKFSGGFGASDASIPATKLFLQGAPALPYNGFWGAALVTVVFLELCDQNAIQQAGQGGRVAGDLNFDPLGFKPKTAAEFKSLRNKELNNGRLGMIAAAGIVAQELVTGEKIFN